MPTPRNVLTPGSFAMLQVIARTGSFAAAARELHMVPSALTYRVRQLEEALDVLLFDRSSRQAKFTRACAELLREGSVYLEELDAVANRVKRVATGWEPEFRISVDAFIQNAELLRLCQAFFALSPPTALTLRTETLSGTLERLTTGAADLALGIAVDTSNKTGLLVEGLGVLKHVYTLSPRHPLAKAPEPLADEVIRRHRATSVADSVLHGEGLTVGILANQDAIMVADLGLAVEAQLRGIGAGYLPAPTARPYLQRGLLVEKAVVRKIREVPVSYAWRRNCRGKALEWWLNALRSPATRAALMGEPQPSKNNRRTGQSRRQSAGPQT